MNSEDMLREGSVIGGIGVNRYWGFVAGTLLIAFWAIIDLLGGGGPNELASDLRIYIPMALLNGFAGFCFGALYERVRLLCLVDPLTGAYNRKYLEVRQRRLLAQARRTRRSGVLVILDLDDFKKVNDEQGHVMGDWLLCRLVCLFKENLRRCDSVVRFGGDEFVLWLPDTTEAEAEAVMARLMSQSAESYHMTFSWGLATYPLSGSSIEGLLSVADRSLYKAKRCGLQPGGEATDIS